MPKQQTSRIVGYDVTVPCSKYHLEEVKEELHKHCNSWVFQQEQGEKTGYEHWQIRCRVKQKCRVSQLIGIFFAKGCNITPTSKEVHKQKNFNYVMKPLTRMAGPWTDRDYAPPPKCTWQMAEFLKKKLYPWQQQVVDILLPLDDRGINIIYDPTGNIGKSYLVEYLWYKRIALPIPPLRSMDDICKAVMSVQEDWWTAYIIDMPRGMLKHKMNEFYSGIETLKNGFVYDTRYQYEYKFIGRPNIVVFTNVVPNLKYMTRDRWNIYTVNDKKELEPRPDLA